jgi:hypothetical protein
MPGNQGGRATQDPDEILDRRRDGESRDKATPVSAPPGSAQADRNGAIAYQAAERLHEEAAAVEGTEASAEISDALTATYSRVLEVFATADLTVDLDTQRQLQGAVQSLARAASTAKTGRRELKTYAAGLVRVMRARAIPTGDAVVDAVTGESADSHARTAIRAAIERIERLSGALGSIPRKYRDQAVAHEAATIATLFYEASTQANQRHPGQNPSKPTLAESYRLSETMEAFIVSCRNLGIEMQSSQLDLILRGADDAVVSMGRKRENYLADYYGARTPADRDAAARGPGSEMTGDRHVDNVIEWIRNGHVSAMLYTDLSSIVTEPPVQKEPSLFEKALIYAVNQALGLGASLAFKALTGVATDAIKGKPKAAGGLASESIGSTDMLRFQGDGNLPDRTPAPNPLRDPKTLRGVVAAMAGKVSDKISGAATAWVGSRVKASLAESGASLATVFMKTVREGAIEDMKARFAETDELREALAMLPPEDVQSLLQDMQARAQSEAEARQADLVMVWASFVAKARLGHDTAGSGTLDTFGEESHDLQGMLGEREGTVQIPVTIRLSPEGIRPTGTVTWANTPKSIQSMEVGGVELNGMSKNALATLRAARIPLGKAKLYRVYNVQVVYDNVVHNGGMFDVTPEGLVDGRRVNPESLAQLGRASGSFWGVAPPVVGSSDPFVLEAIRMIMKLDVDTGAIK